MLSNTQATMRRTRRIETAAIVLPRCGAQEVDRVQQSEQQQQQQQHRGALTAVGGDPHSTTPHVAKRRRPGYAGWRCSSRLGSGPRFVSHGARSTHTQMVHRTAHTTPGESRSRGPDQRRRAVAAAACRPKTRQGSAAQKFEPQVARIGAAAQMDEVSGVAAGVPKKRTAPVIPMTAISPSPNGILWLRLHTHQLVKL